MYEAAGVGADQRDGALTLIETTHSGMWKGVEIGDRVALFKGGGYVTALVTEQLGRGRFRGRIEDACEVLDQRLRRGNTIRFHPNYVHICWKGWML